MAPATENPNNINTIKNQKAKVLNPFLYIITKVDCKTIKRIRRTTTLTKICVSVNFWLKRKTETKTKMMTISLMNSEGLESLLVLSGFILMIFEIRNYELSHNIITTTKVTK